MTDSKPQPSAGPVQAWERIDFVDVLRGFAVLGILAGNMTSYAGLSTGVHDWTNALDRTITGLSHFLVEAKFYSLFSLLFGWGMAVQMERAEARGARFVPRYARRLLILLIFGLIHGILIWHGDILVTYALYGFLLLPFRKRSEKTILVSALLALLLSIVVTLPGNTMDAFRAWYQDATDFLRYQRYAESVHATGSYREIIGYHLQRVLSGRSWFIYTFGNVFGMFLLGLYIGKRHIFQEIDRYLPLVRRVLWLGLIVGVAFNGFYVLLLFRPELIPAEYYRLATRGARTIGAPALMLFYVSGIILLLQNTLWQQRLAPLASVGRMALTNYLGQSVIGALIFFNYGLGVFGRIDPVLGLILVVVIYLGQIRFSEWWLERYRFGPMEWLWRTLTYGRIQPLREGASSTGSEPGLWQRMRQTAGRIDPRLVLAAAWLLLLLWAAALGVWYIQLEGRGGQAGLVPEVSGSQALVTPVPTEAGSSGGTLVEDQSEIEAPAVAEGISTPVVEPVAYDPGPLAASGDLMGLASAFGVDTALAEIEALTDPAFSGRYPASPGGWAAGDYIAQQFARYGLQPAGDDGTYFQAFPFEYIALATTPSLEVKIPGGELHDDYAVYRDYSAIVRDYLGAGTAEGEVVWANGCSQDDLDTVDAVDKIVLCRSRTTAQAGRNALEHGATGLLLLTDPAQRLPDFGTTYFEPLVPEPIPALRVYPQVVQDLLTGSDHTLEDLSTSFDALDLESQATIEVRTSGPEACAVQGCQARNVLGVLPGRDPELADQIIILGAHYDHLGQSPDGTIWRGANDDASGVAVLLELARSWQEQGYVPRHTVLFAAWDAEEEGLLGARHYVEKPRYPLDDTAAMIQFDMVGSGGDTLWIDGGGDLGAYLHQVAEALGVASEITHAGRSDHVPFQEAGVSASLLIWRFDQDVQPQYHRPVDTPDIIEADKLAAAAKIAELTVLGLSEGESAITGLLDRRVAAIEQGDLPAFLTTSLPQVHSAERLWFADLQSLQEGLPSPRFKLDVSDLRVVGRSATATVHLTFDFPAEDRQEPQSTTITLDARFKHDGQGWRWAGPELDWIEGVDGFAVAAPPGRQEEIGELGQQAAALYAEIATTLDLPAETDAALMLFPDTASLRASTALSLPSGQNVWTGPGSLRLTYSSEISASQRLADGLVQLALAEAGVSEGAAPWLWQGLTLALRTRTDPIGAQAEYVPRLQNLLATDSLPANEATAWAAVDYMRRQVGWQGIGQFVAGLGRACSEGLCEDTAGQDRALEEILRLDSATFESAWQEDWRARLTTTQAELDAVLAARTEAVLHQDEGNFLGTVDPGVPNLIAEEQYWFDSLQQHALDTFSLAGNPVAILEDGSVLAQVTMDYRFAGDDSGPGDEGSIPMRVQLTPGDSGLRWAGMPWQSLQGDQVRLLTQDSLPTLAGDLLQVAEEIYPQLARQVGLADAGPLTLKVYGDRQAFRSGISLSYPLLDWALAWTGEGTSVKLLLAEDATVDELRPVLAVQLARNLLQQMGVDDEWLLKGASLYLAGSVDGGATAQTSALELPQALTALARNKPLPPLESMQPDHKLAQEEFDLVRALAWDTARYLAQTHGPEGLLSVLQNQARGDNLDAALRAAIGQTLPEFEAAWAESLRRAHVPPAWLEIANAFDEEKAARHVAHLAGPAYAGRQAGSSGAEAAAAYLAGLFAEYGLQPAGENGTFYQRFPLVYMTLPTAPQLEIVDQDGQRIESLAYRHDMLALFGEQAGGGQVSGELVWVRDENYEGMDLAGKIALRRPSQEISAEVEQAIAHGAGGLILIGSLETRKEMWAKPPLPSQPPGRQAIPVLQLTAEGTKRLLETIGHTSDSLAASPPALPLGLKVRMDVPLSEPETVQSANVLGLLPGSDPELAREVIVLGAHYDHVGDDPSGEAGEGLRYDGANDDASGLAVLLEMARLWQATGYRPKRSILFAAWGAQEPGELGSRYYVEHPVLPLADTLAMLQLDTVSGGEGYYLEAQGGGPDEGLLLFNLHVADEWFEGRLSLRALWGRSDHLPFDEAGVPALLITWRDSSEENWPVEIAEEVEPYRLGVAGRFVALTVMATAR